MREKKSATNARSDILYNDRTRKGLRRFSYEYVLTCGKRTARKKNIYSGRGNDGYVWSSREGKMLVECAKRANFLEKYSFVSYAKVEVDFIPHTWLYSIQRVRS